MSAVTIVSTTTKANRILRVGFGSRGSESLQSPVKHVNIMVPIAVKTLGATMPKTLGPTQVGNAGEHRLAEMPIGRIGGLVLQGLVGQARYVASQCACSKECNWAQFHNWVLGSS